MGATTPTALYCLDPKTAEMADAMRYADVPPSGMGIVFERDGTLCVTNCGGGSALSRIDPTTSTGEKIANFSERNVRSAGMEPDG